MSHKDIHCSLCGDEAAPGVVRAVNPRDRTAQVELACAVQLVALDLVGTVTIGDTLLVHQGFAIAKMEKQ